MRSFMLMILAVALCAGNAFGQVEQGDKEIQGVGTMVFVEGANAVMINVLYGYYYTQKLEIGGGLMVTHSGNYTTIGPSVFAKYSFSARDKLVPYIGGTWYQMDIAPEDPIGFFDMSFLLFTGGAKYFVNEYVAYDFSGNLGIGLGGGDVTFILLAGISVIF